MSPEILHEICELTSTLVGLRLNGCAHLCVENVGPEIFAKLLEAYSETFEA